MSIYSLSWDIILNINQLSIADGGITKIDSDLKTQCPLLNEVDLTRNGWEDWKIVEELGEQIPLLSILTLSGNFLRHLTEPPR